jgi:uncharacterized protein with von Willebrand factor type A (vWA) domain
MAIMRQEQAQRLTASIVEFSRFLRSHGFSADMRRTMTALEAVTAIDVTNSQSLIFALQTTLCSNHEEWERFPQLFRQFWGESHPRPRSAAGEYKGSSKNDSEDRQDGSTIFLDQAATNAAADGKGKAVYGASAQQRLKKVDFSEVPSDDLAALEEISARLLRRMSMRLSRRLAISNRASRVDLRRSIRRSIAHGGEPITLAWKARKLSRNKFVLLIDISGSMNFYSLFLVRFAYALQASFQRVQTFLFSTDIVGISDLLRARSLPNALRQLSQRAAGWSGGTKIGESLSQFNRLYGRNVLTRDTIFMILSDGWETGDPHLLADQMRVARRRVSKILWLNPLLGLKDYQPLTRGMAAALPYVDIFAPAHNLESLLALEKHL